MPYLPIGLFAGCPSLASLVIGQGVADLPSAVSSLLGHPSALVAIDVHPANLDFSSLDRVLYNKTRSA